MDFVITVCNDAAGEVCPVWPGRPLTAHWGVEDPSQRRGTDVQKLEAFWSVAGIVKHRIEAFADLPHETLDRRSIAGSAQDIGRS